MHPVVYLDPTSCVRFCGNPDLHPFVMPTTLMIVQNHESTLLLSILRFLWPCIDVHFCAPDDMLVYLL